MRRAAHKLPTAKAVSTLASTKRRRAGNNGIGRGCLPHNTRMRPSDNTSGASPKTFTYIVIKFKAFDFEKGEAVFELLLRDEAEKVRLEYLNQTDE